MRKYRWIAATLLAACVAACNAPAMAVTASSLAQLRSLGAGAVNNTNIILSHLGGDPHPVTGVVTPGHYWINGDHIANPTNSHPIFMELGGTGNTYDLSGATINLDTRKLDGFGRNLGHGSGVDVLRISGSNNIVQGINLIGQDIALDTDPNAQRYADWSTVYVEMSGDNNMVDGANVVTRGSRTDAYGLGDAFGKGASGGIQPFLGHRKASAFRVGEATNAVINDMHLNVNTFGHGFFVQQSTNTTLTNSTVTGELFPSQGVIDHPLYQEHGHTFHQNEIPDDIFISGAEGGVRMYTGSSGITVENVVVTNMRAGFSTSLGGGTKTLNNVEAYGVEAAFGVGTNTTITNAKADGVNGPVVVFDRNDVRDTTVEVELVGDQPFNTDYALAYVNGNRVNVSFSSDRPAEDFEDTTLFRTAQFYYDNWRETNNTTTFDVAGYDHINSVLINDTNTRLILGTQATGNVGRSLGPVIGNGKENYYDGVTLVPTGSRLEVVHEQGLGNSGTETGAEFDGSFNVFYTGTATAQTFEDNATVVESGATLEIQPGIRIADEKLTISGDGVDGNGALYSDGSNDSNTRFGSSNSSDESTIFLDGNASIGVGVAGNQLLVGRIQGVGNLTKLGPGSLTIGKSSTYDGDLHVAEGHVTIRPGVVHTNLTVATGASISSIGNSGFNTTDDIFLDGMLDLNGRTDDNTLSGVVGKLHGTGAVVSTNAFAGTGGVLEIAGATGAADFSGTISTNVSIVKSGDNSQTLSGTLTHSGTTSITSGALLINGTHTGGDSYSVAGGTLGGNGSIDAGITIESGGTLAPGSSAGQLTVEQLVFETGSTLEIEIGGLTAGTEYDQLVGDSVTLSGDLAVSLLDLGSGLFIPNQTDTFSVLDATSLTGMFDNVVSGTRLDTTGGEGSFLVTYDSASDMVLLSDFALTAPSGDYDGDGDVDGADFLLIQSNGMTAGDLADWQTNYGSADALSGATAVPEPSTAALILMSVSMLSMKRSRP